MDCKERWLGNGMIFLCVWCVTGMYFCVLVREKQEILHLLQWFCRYCTCFISVITFISFNKIIVVQGRKTGLISVIKVPLFNSVYTPWIWGWITFVCVWHRAWSVSQSVFIFLLNSDAQGRLLNLNDTSDSVLPSASASLLSAHYSVNNRPIKMLLIHFKHSSHSRLLNWTSYCEYNASYSINLRKI